MTAAPQSFIPSRPPTSKTAFKTATRPVNVERTYRAGKLAQFPTAQFPAKIKLAPAVPKLPSVQSIPIRLATPSQRASGVPTTTVRRLPQPKSSPSWLRLLLMLQRSSGGLALLLGASLLAVYGWTVYIQQVWGKDHHSLQVLQRQERQLSVANEILSSQLAQEAENPNSGLILPQPGDAIFLEAPAPVSSMGAEVAPILQDVVPLPVNLPQGY